MNTAHSLTKYSRLEKIKLTPLGIITGKTLFSSQKTPDSDSDADLFNTDLDTLIDNPNPRQPMLNSYSYSFSENELSHSSQNQVQNTVNYFKLTEKDSRPNIRKKYSVTSKSSIYKPKIISNLNRLDAQHNISFIVKGNSFILN